MFLNKKGIAVKAERKAFTIVELLTVVTIMLLLLGILIPSVIKIKAMVKETKQRAQLNTIELALQAFKNDTGNYPPSAQYDGDGIEYCGAQRLAEAMVGQDYLGFHKRSQFYQDGELPTNEDLYPDDLDPGTQTGRDNLDERKDSYLDQWSDIAFKLEDVVYNSQVGALNGELPVLCDVYNVKKITIQQGTKNKNYQVGTPILYYRARTFSKIFEDTAPDASIYSSNDNYDLLYLGKIKNGDRHRLFTTNGTSGTMGRYFYNEDYKIVDPKKTTNNMTYPYNPDTFILISAGPDGEYGTVDDILNIDK